MDAYVNNALWKWIRIQPPLFDSLRRSEGEIFFADKNPEPDYTGKIVRLEALGVGENGILQYRCGNFEVLGHRPAYPGGNDRDLEDIRA